MKRYRLAIDSDDNAYGYESPTGEWVKWEDVEILDRSFTASEAKRHELETDIKVLSDELIQSHTYIGKTPEEDKDCTCQACEVARRYTDEKERT